MVEIKLKSRYYFTYKLTQDPVYSRFICISIKSINSLLLKFITKYIAISYEVINLTKYAPCSHSFAFKSMI